MKISEWDDDLQEWKEMEYESADRNTHDTHSAYDAQNREKSILLNNMLAAGTVMAFSAGKLACNLIPSDLKNKLKDIMSGKYDEKI